MRRIRNKRKSWWPKGREFPEHCFVPDPQIAAGVPLQHFKWLAHYLCEQKPDVIILGGDWWEFKSLCSHESWKANYRTRDFIDDILSGFHALDIFLGILAEEYERSGWHPIIVFLEGNHDERYRRIGQEDLRLYRACPGPRAILRRYFGDWDPIWVPYRKMICIDGIHYAHTTFKPGSNRPIGGTAENRITKMMDTTVVGHSPGIMSATRHLASGRRIRMEVAGSFYLHDEAWMANNNYWRGVLYIHEPDGKGWFDKMEVSMGFLKRRYDDGKPVLADGTWREKEVFGQTRAELEAEEAMEAQTTNEYPYV